MPSSSPPPELQAGDLIGGKYRLEKLLGEGAMGTVWAARNEATERAFAVKFMLPQYATDPTLVQRFLNEAKACGRLEHPSIVEIYDLGRCAELDGAPFLVMELLRGEGLDQLFRRAKRLEPTHALTILLEVARALDLAHEAGVVHRDVKPANIFLHRNRDGVVVPKILDFGVAKNFDTDDPLNLTRAGTLVGSPLYMSPEQARGQSDLDPRSDVWSLGVILYQAIAGRVPFDERSYNAVLSAILTHRHKSLNELVPGLPDILSETVDLCLVKDRDRRMQSAAQLAARIEDVLLYYEATAAPPAEDDRTEVMDRALMDELVPESAREDEPVKDRSAFLRRQWLADVGKAVSTAATDGIDDNKATLPKGPRPSAAPAAPGLVSARGSLRPPPGEPSGEVDDAQEGSAEDNRAAIRAARRALEGGVTTEALAMDARPRRRGWLLVGALFVCVAAAVALFVLSRG